jgi:hemerythrin-like domain-containing protein
MCEYCGCQQIATIGELTAEHDAVVAEMSHVRTHLGAGRMPEAAASVRRMAGILDPHTRVEEEGLFPELATEFPDHIAALRAEHREVEGVLAEARDGVPLDPTWPERLLATFEVLREHILKEQDGVFPAALASLDGAQWERVEAVRSRSRP